jgi:hypothetical protein
LNGEQKQMMGTIALLLLAIYPGSDLAPDAMAPAGTQ